MFGQEQESPPYSEIGTPNSFPSIPPLFLTPTWKSHKEDSISTYNKGGSTAPPCCLAGPPTPKPEVPLHPLSKQRSPDPLGESCCFSHSETSHQPNRHTVQVTLWVPFAMEMARHSVLPLNHTNPWRLILDQQLANS